MLHGLKTERNWPANIWATRSFGRTPHPAAFPPAWWGPQFVNQRSLTQSGLAWGQVETIWDRKASKVKMLELHMNFIQWRFLAYTPPIQEQLEPWFLCSDHQCTWPGSSLSRYQGPCWIWFPKLHAPAGTLAKSHLANGLSLGTCWGISLSHHT